jgi:hypothetical protein
MVKGRDAVNVRAIAPALTNERELEKIAPFMKHIEYLFPKEAERDFFLSWMSFTVRYPGWRCKFTPLLVSTKHGTGRGFLVELMQKLLGVENTSVAKMGTMSAEMGFQDYLYKSVFCAVHEIREGVKNAFAISDQVRDILTEDHLNLNLKYGKNGMQPVYVNFLLMSNHIDALKLGEEDRRIWVSAMRDEPKSEAYYKELYKWKNRDGEGVGALFSWLMKRDIKGWNGAGRAPMTAAKRQMIGASTSIAKEAFMRLIGAPPVDLMGQKDVVAEVRRIVGEEDIDDALKVASGEITHLLQENCTQLEWHGQGAKRIKVVKRDSSEGEVRPWVLANPTRWNVATNEECKAEMERLYLGIDW